MNYFNLVPMPAKDREVEEWEQRQKHERNDRLFLKVGFGELYKNMCFADYREETEKQKECKKKGMRFASLVTSGKWGNLILTGPCGAGKTSLMACVARQVTETPDNRDGYLEKFGVCNNFSAKYVKSEYVSEQFLRSQSFSNRSSLENMIADEFSCDLVIVDEIGTGGQKEEEAMFELIDWCSRTRRCMMLATNLDRDNLTKLLGVRSCSRLRCVTNIIDFSGMDDMRAIFNKI